MSFSFVQGTSVCIDMCFLLQFSWPLNPLYKELENFLLCRRIAPRDFIKVTLSSCDKRGTTRKADVITAITHS